MKMTKNNHQQRKTNMKKIMKIMLKIYQKKKINAKTIIMLTEKE